MKIIFDSEKQRENLFKAYCPYELGLPGCSTSNCGLSVRLGDIPKVEVCRKCWEECGLEHEVKEK